MGVLEHEPIVFVDAVLTGDLPSVKRLEAPCSDLPLLLGGQGPLTTNGKLMITIVRGMNARASRVGTETFGSLELSLWLGVLSSKGFVVL